jgi:hypothetical protein
VKFPRAPRAESEASIAAGAIGSATAAQRMSREELMVLGRPVDAASIDRAKSPARLTLNSPHTHQTNPDISAAAWSRQELRTRDFAHFLG